MKVTPTPLSGLFEVRNSVVADARGRFSRIFCEEELRELRPGLHFTQVNLSETTARGTVRGMHFQLPPAAEAKLIRCLRGQVFDVAVDVRENSPTFLQWHSIELSEDADLSVFIPEGFAHGFQSLSDNAQLLYMHTERWNPAREAGLRHDDPDLGIRWPLAISESSSKDRSYPKVRDGFLGVRL